MLSPSYTCSPYDSMKFQHHHSSIQSVPVITMLLKDGVRQITSLFLGVFTLWMTSQMAYPLQPVPITLQTLGIVLVAVRCSPYQTFLCVSTWIGLGALGLPMFANLNGGSHCLVGPTGGYLWGMLLSAPLISIFSFYGRKVFGASFKKNAGLVFAFYGLLSLFASALIMLLGWVQLQFILDSGHKAWKAGIEPFLIGEVLKAIVMGAYAIFFLRSQRKFL